MPHVCEEIVKFQPSPANPNSSCSVEGVLDTVPICASLNHVSPNAVRFSFVGSLTLAMPDSSAHKYLLQSYIAVVIVQTE